jgi:hypothetical protein
MVQITMKYLFLFTQFIITFSKRIITNYNVPACKNCVFFKRSISFPEFTHMSYCTQFGTKDIILDKITHDRALNCRTDENKCGIGGRCFYERKACENIFNHFIIPKLQKTLTMILIISSIVIRSIFS